MERLANFCEVADAGSIVGAAKGDTVTQSLISRQIREMETFFGTDLVQRRGRGIVLTERGRELAAIGRENFKGIADFVARCRGSEWCVRIVASNSVAQWLILPRLGTVMKLCPTVRFEIHHEQTREMVSTVREGTYDLAFIREDSIQNGLRHAPLGDFGHSIFIPASLLKRPPKCVSEIPLSLPMALPIGGRLKEQVEKFFDRAGTSIQTAVACSSYLQAANLVRSGTCAAALPDLALAEMSGVEVHRIPVPVKLTLCLAWTARNADTRPALSDLIEVMVQTLRWNRPQPGKQTVPWRAIKL